jgi:5-methylcytosine-specific restriction endonuclease McrBC GTP-binding regulatory subunit McrB
MYYILTNVEKKVTGEPGSSSPHPSLSPTLPIPGTDKTTILNSQHNWTCKNTIINAILKWLALNI